MNEEILTVLRELALRSKTSSWWQPWQMAEQTGNADAEFIAALSPEIVLELLYEIERRHGIGSALLECRNSVHALQLDLETERSAANMYAKQVAHWIEKHDALLAQQLESGSHFPVRQCVECENYNLPLDQGPCASCVQGGNIGDNFKPAAESYNNAAADAA